MTDPSVDTTSIAVIGMAGRFPGAASVAELWQNLLRGAEAVRHFTDEELRAAGVPDELLAKPNYIRTAPALDGAELFDPGFFGYSPGQAARIDPQHRLFLEAAWEVIEQAGYDVESYADPIGVFAGSSANSYADAARQDVRSTSDAHQLLVDSSSSFLAMRVSYKLNLRGPSISVQTACSTSLVAVHLACQSLLNFECTMALAGAASVRIPPLGGYVYDEGGILSPDGHCRAFDADAKGTTPGSGAAVVLLKRLADAVRDGDQIRAVIRATAVNNDGSRKVGFAAPAFHGQVDVLSMALEFAGVEPGQIGLVEAHGTGTVLGDAVELAALTEVFRGERSRPCALGSLKASIGHLDAAAGVAGLIKAILCLENRALVPSLHYRQPNPALAAADSPFQVQTELRPWEADEPRLAGVSSFGVGGTNAHAVVEEAPERPARAERREEQVVPLSARSPAALAAARANLAAHLRDHRDALADVAYTLQVGRKRFRHRLAVVAADADELVAALSRPAGSIESGESEDRPLVVVLPGEVPRPGSIARPGAVPWFAAAAALRDSEPIFAGELDRCARLVAQVGLDARAILVEPGGADQDAAERGSRLAAFLVEYCLGRLWLRLGLTPTAIIGCGTGELSAACLAEVLSVEEAALRLQAGATHMGGGATDSPESMTAYAMAANAMAANAVAPDAVELLRAPWHLFVELGLGPSIEDATRRRAGAPLAWMAPHADGAAGDRRGRLDALAALWTRGAAIDWARHGAGERRYRVSLPTYPFERQRCWPSSVDRAPAGHDRAPHAMPDERSTVAEERPPLDEWFYIPSWQSSLPPPPPVFDAADRAGRWLIFADQGGLGDELGDRLRAEGCSVATVLPGAAPGAAYESLGGGAFRIDPDDLDHHRRLLGDLAAGGPLRKVIHCWSLPTSGARSRRGGFESFLHFLRATAAVAPIDVLAITRGAYAVAGDDAPFTPRVGLAALCTVAAQEVPGLNLAVIDLPADAPEATGTADRDRAYVADRDRAYVDWLLGEARRPPGAALVAYRGRSRLVQAVARVELDASAPALRAIRSGGAYVITGGLGAIGLALASHLARSAPVKLALVVRGWFPRADDWDRHLAAGKPGDLLVERIRRLRELEALGAEVLVQSVDVGDPAAVRAAIERAVARLGPIHGAFHLAADIRHSSIRTPVSSLEPADFEAQLHPKLDGLHALAAALAGQPLDFAVAFSSNASLLGGVGFGAYAAANACVDHAVAALARSTGVAWMATNWDGWLLARNPADQPPRLPAGLAPYAIDGSDGMAALLRIVAHSTAPQIAVSAGDLGHRLRTCAVRAERASIDRSALDRSSIVRSGIDSPEATAGAAAEPADRAAMTDLERAIADIWEDVLGVSGVGANDDFFELSGDSLTGLRVLVRIRELFQVDIQLETLLEDAPTVSTLAVEIVSRLAAVKEPAFVQEQLDRIEGAV
jgi:acyl transferase domain-containing protein/acyl carrier protein